jgi:hypothetical protein
MVVASSTCSDTHQVLPGRQIVGIVVATALLVGSVALTASASVLGAGFTRDERGELGTFPSAVWRGGHGSRWSDPASWQGGVVPGPGVVARFDRSSGDAIVDSPSIGAVAGLLLEPGFRGTIRLERDILVRGAVLIAGGTLEQGSSRLSARAWRQSGGVFVGGTAALSIESDARVRGGLLATPSGEMRVERLEIRAPGVVRIGSNGKLNITGGGEPLSGDGLLDTTTNRPTSVEYTGSSAADVTAAGPARGLQKLGVAERRRDSRERRRRGTSGTAAARKGLERTFSVSGERLWLNRGEDSLNCAVIDTANGFAYFGTSTTPGIVVKVSLATFTKVGALTLAAGEDSLLSAVIDPGNGFAYFGTETDPGIVVKVNLQTFTRAGALTLDAGEGALYSAVIDTANGFACFGTDTNPGIVVKINLASLSRVGALTLNAGESYLGSAVIDTANGLAYFGAWTSPGMVVKVNASTLTRVDALAFNAGESGASSAVIDTSNGFAYFGTDTSPGKVVKVNLTSFTRVGALTLDTGEDYLYSAVIDPASGFACFGTDSSPANVVKVNLATLTRVGGLALDSGERSPYCAVIDTSGGFAYFGTFTSPGQVVKIALATLTRVAGIELFPGESFLASSVVDPVNGFAYFGTDTDPGVVIKVDLATMTRVGALVLGAGESYLFSAVIDPASGVACFGTATEPGIVVKIDLATFTRAGALPLSVGEDLLYTAVIDPANDFAYFGTWTSPGIVVKVQLSPLTRVGALTLASGENMLGSSVINAANGYACFGTWTSPARVVKVNLAALTRTGALSLNSGEDYATSAVLDPGSAFAYFGTDTDPARVVKVNCASLTRTGSLSLDAGESYLYSAVIDPPSGFAYFGSYISPGIVTRIDLGNTVTSVVSSVNPSVLGQAVLFTATVAARVGGSGTPTGTVAFKDGGAVITGCGAVSLDGAGQAACGTSALAVGTHTITVESSGNGPDWNPSIGTLAGGQVVSGTTAFLTVAKTGAGSGVVTSSPVGIDCGTTCSFQFAVGAVVTLSASASAGANFAGWSGEGCGGVGTCQVTMSQARNVSAMFVPLAPLAFVPVAPCRVFDTRLSSGAEAGAPALATGERRLFTVTGKCNVAADAKAVSANLTVVGATAAGDLRVVAGHVTSTTTSALSIPVERARANNALVQLSAAGDGSILVINATTGTVHLILDVNGYFH